MRAQVALRATEGTNIAASKPVQGCDACSCSCVHRSGRRPNTSSPSGALVIMAARMPALGRVTVSLLQINGDGHGGSCNKSTGWMALPLRAGSSSAWHVRAR